MTSHRIPALAALLLLAACGADGRPVPPPPEPEETRRGGITLSGSIGAGVAGGSVSGTVSQ